MPAPPPPLAQIRAGVYELVLDVARTSITEYAVEELLRRVCVELTELCGLAGCVAGLVDGATGSLRTLIGSHPEAEQLTRLVRQLGEGTGQSALRARPIVPAENLTRARTVLAEAAGKVGLPVTASVVLAGVEEPVGFLQLFSPDEARLSEHVLRELVPLADVLGIALHDAGAYEYSASLVSQLSEALDAQRPIEQAKGLLAERHRVDLAAAYRMLREQAHRREVSVTVVATEVVAQSWRSRADLADPADPARPSGSAGSPRESDPPPRAEHPTADSAEPGTAPLPAQRGVPTERTEAERHTLF
ncbi:MAG TPA: GAF and ANTAR domain-containing protein [Pseudonocardia sp.]|jgi:hypothetical protein